MVVVLLGVEVVLDVVDVVVVLVAVQQTMAYVKVVVLKITGPVAELPQLALTV